MSHRLDPLDNKKGHTHYIDHKAQFPRCESKTPGEICDQQVESLKEDMDEGVCLDIEVARVKGFWQSFRFNLANQARRRATLLDCAMYQE